MWDWAKCKRVVQVGKSLLLDFGLATQKANETNYLKRLAQSQTWFLFNEPKPITLPKFDTP